MLALLSTPNELTVGYYIEVSEVVLSKRRAWRLREASGTMPANDLLSVPVPSTGHLSLCTLSALVKPLGGRPLLTGGASGAPGGVSSRPHQDSFGYLRFVLS